MPPKTRTWYDWPRWRMPRTSLEWARRGAVVDAAAMWTDEEENYLVTSLLRAVGGDEAAGAAYLALTGIDEVRQWEQSEGPPE